MPNIPLDTPPPTPDAVPVPAPSALFDRPTPGTAIVGDQSTTQFPTQGGWAPASAQAWMAAQPPSQQELQFAAEQRAEDARYEEELMMNARINRASQGIAAARQFMDRRKFARDVQGALSKNLSPGEALTFGFMRNPGVLATMPGGAAIANRMMHPTPPPFTPRVETMEGGLKVIRHGLHGESATPVPAAATRPYLPPLVSKEVDSLNREKAGILKELGTPVNMRLATRPNYKPFFDELRGRVKKINSRLQAINAKYGGYQEAQDQQQGEPVGYGGGEGGEGAEGDEAAPAPAPAPAPAAAQPQGQVRVRRKFGDKKVLRYEGDPADAIKFVQEHPDQYEIVLDGR